MTTPKLLFVAAALVASVAPARADEVKTTAITARALVMHVPPLTAKAGAPIELSAHIDAPFAEALAARWRPVGGTTWIDAVFERSSAGGWFATLPAATPPGIEYYIAGRTAAGVEVPHFASATAPHTVAVVAGLFDRLAELDRRRLADRMNEVSLGVYGHNFGNRYDVRDQFLRGDLVYTRRMLRELYQVSFGFGSILGHTPRYDGQMIDDVERSLDYGFGEVRVRPHPSFFLDLRGIFGASHREFVGGIRGQVIFGKPWRSSVFVGGEVIGDLGASGWVRLQWDTAAPLLMGASITTTDLPGATVAAAGLYVAYDVTMRVVDRLAVRAQLSYGSRDGRAHLGGGLGTALDF